MAKRHFSIVAGWFACSAIFVSAAYFSASPILTAADQLSTASPSQAIQGPADAIREMEASAGADRVRLQLSLLKRRDLPLESRESIANELIQSADGDALILGSGYAALGAAQGMKGDLTTAVTTLEKAEGYGRRCAEQAPNVFFNARCNRAMFITVSGGDRDQVVQLLQEAIEFSKAHADQLEIGFPYITLAHLAEDAGAVYKSLEYVQMAFNLAVEKDKVDTAAQAGETIIAILYADGQYEVAQQWVPKIEPWIQKASDPLVKSTFAMRKEDLRSATGDPSGAATALRGLAETQAQNARPSNTQLRGLIYLSLAAAELAAKEYEKSLAAADVAIVELQGFPRNKLLAILLRLDCLHAMGDAAAALAGCDQLLSDEQPGSLARVRTLELRARSLKTLGRDQEAFVTLQECREQESQRNAQRSREQAQFMTAAYNSQHQEHELALVRAQHAAAESRAALHQTTAQREMATAENARLIQNMTIVLSLVALGLCAFVMQTRWQRNSTLALAKREHELNTQMQERLATQAAELQQELITRRQLEMAVERKFRDEALGKLTGGVAHDFNNLLMVIVHSLELLRQNNPALSAESTGLLDAMTHAADSGASIVSQLMAYSRQQPLAPRPLSISHWLNSSGGMLRQMMGKSVDYQQQDLSEDAMICIDNAQLTTAVLNLLANARDAIEGSGSIHFTISAVKLDTHACKLWNDLQPGQYCQFEIRDSGKGMTAEQLAHACEPFYTTKSQGAGTGLGLSSVLGFVKQSGGDFRLISQPGSGTMATFLLPQCERPVNESAGETTQPQSSTLRRLLLVEDQEQVRMVLATGLRSIGYSITQAASADEAIKIIEASGMPEFVLSDVRMPGSMNGLQLRRWILARYPSAHIVVMSGYRDQDADDDPSLIFVQKPIKLQELHRLLSESPKH